MDDIHILIGDVALLVGFICLGALEDHEATLGLEKLVVFLLGTVRWLAGLRSRLLGLSLLAEGATNVDLHGGVVFEKMLRLPPWNGHRDSSAFSKCSGHIACSWG